MTGIRSCKFNESVAIGLTEWYDETTERKMVDEFSRLSGGGIVKSKDPRELVECVLNNWISKCGCPRKILHDNGRELVNDLFLKMTDVVNLRSIATPAY